MLADFQVGNAFAYRLHDARIFGARHKWQRWFHLVFVLHDQQVREIQAGSLDLNQHLAGLGLRGGHFFPGQGVNADGVLTKPGMHGKFSKEVARMIEVSGFRKCLSRDPSGKNGQPPTIHENSVCT